MSSGSSQGVHAGEKAGVAVFLQADCCRHRYDGTEGSEDIFELPERLHSVNLGLAAALARLSVVSPSRPKSVKHLLPSGEYVNSEHPEAQNVSVILREVDDWERTREPRASKSDRLYFEGLNLTLVQNVTRKDVLDDMAITWVHPPSYIENIRKWAQKGTLPQSISGSDLWLCSESFKAIKSALEAVSEAVDSVMVSRPVIPSLLPISKSSESVHHAPSVKAPRAFVSIRPPGHHCNGDVPAGFCWVNNVAIATAQAIAWHQVSRVVIFDIDLHHGNGTQKFVQLVNSISHGADATLRVFYGSLHDIRSFPCEDGDPELIEAASLSTHNADHLPAQYIHNVHLQAYSSEKYFWKVLYDMHYHSLITRAQAFVEETGTANDVLVLISCGFDASEYEDPSISRHHRKVPTSFFYEFTKDAVAFAERYADGRIISILEGGYNDRALISGAMAHLCGLVDMGEESEDSDSEEVIDTRWWSRQNLVKLEQAIKNPPKHSRSTRSREPWITNTIDTLEAIEEDFGRKQRARKSRQLDPGD